MGYRGLERSGRQGPTSSSFNVKSGVHKKKFSISGEAFGVGAYEEDDEDVYNRFVLFSLQGTFYKKK